MIVVDVGDQHDLGVCDSIQVDLVVATQVDEPPGQRRVGEEGHAAQVEADRCVPDPRDRLAVGRHTPSVGATRLRVVAARRTE